MGQRANYIVKNGLQQTIHYTHWRANCILSDLYLGEKRFLAYVEKCQVHHEMLTEPWIEGCVIIDTREKHLYFWSHELLTETSVIERYVAELSKKWQGWEVAQLKNRMYDAEKVLQINYVSRQEHADFHIRSAEDIVNDRIEDWETALVVIRQADQFLVVRTADITIECIISYGTAIINLLLSKPASFLPVEGTSQSYEYIVIDTIAKRINISACIFDLWEQFSGKWEGYQFTMGDVGYIETMRRGGIDTAGLLMPTQKITEEFNGIVREVEGADPFELADKLLKEDKDIQFNPAFFDNVKPTRTPFQKLKAGFRKLLRLK